ncbi:MAG TPA: tetratricopeptide repeat protein [Terriglobia bacterium]|nr:tetratricopeptide repeat protein [Terriglobia bacterium]
MKLLLTALLGLGTSVYAQTGEELFQKGQYAEAAAAFERQPVSIRSAASSNFLGISHHMLGRFKEAQVAYEHAIKAAPDLAAPRNNLGALFYSQQMFSDADREFRRAAERNAENSTITANLHWARYARDNVRNARERAIEVIPGRPRLLEPTDNPRGDFLAVVSLMPPTVVRQVESLVLRADIFMVRKAFDDAVIEYKKAIALDRYDSSVINRLGIAYHNLQKYRDSEQQYREVLRLRPNHIDAMNNLAVIDYVRGDYESALRRYRTALKLKPDSATIMRNMGACLFALERWDEAVAIYQQALVLRPDLFEPQPSGAGTQIQMHQQQGAMINFYLGKVFALRGDTDSAFSFLMKAVDAGFDNIKMLKEEEAFKGLVADERFDRLLKTMAERKPGDD